MEENISKSLEEGIEIMKCYFYKYYAIWEEFGIDSETKFKREKIIWRHINTLLQAILDEEVSNLKNLKERIQKYTKKVGKLCTLLSLTPKQDNDLSLVKREENLVEEIDILVKLKHKRLRTYQDLRGIEAVYCSSLGVDKFQLPNFAGIPSENELLQIEQHIEKLKREHDKRLKKFCLAKKELSTILEVTEITPETSLEGEILSGNEVSLADETFKTLEEFITRAQEKKTEREALKKSLLNKLSTLWDRLGVPDSKKIEFLSKHVDCKSSTLDFIKEEVEICEKVKKESITQGIANLRKELNQLWEVCYASESQKKDFIMYNSNEVNDDVLIAYESEVKKWKDYYKEVEHILTRIKRRNELWKLLQVFSSKSTDPNRFKNRGGVLLKEEKERKVLLKDLPALEDGLLTEIELYESAFDKRFTYYGEDFKTVITRQWQERNCQKENERSERQKRRSLETESDSAPVTPAKNLLLRTPNSAPHKTLKITPKASVYCTPKSEFDAAENFASVVKFELSSSDSFDAEKDVFLSINNISKTDQRINPTPVPQQQISDKVMSDLSNCTTYSMFANELDSPSKHDCQSSLLTPKKCDEAKSPHSYNKKETPKLQKGIINSKTPHTLVRGKLGLPFLF